MSKLRYMPRLDGLRALAVGGVLIDHFVHAPAIQMWGLGHAGVVLFFVLSGFLITSILLDERDRSSGAGEAAVWFYGRRLLRLSPPLWLAIAGAAALGIANMRHDWWKHGLYLTNFMVARSHSWIGPMHFWTLSVEEQFYLGWFFVAVAAPRRWLLPTILACLVIGPTYRAMMAHPTDRGWPITLLPGQVDSLALGAVLAWARRSPDGAALARLFESRASLFACLAAAVLLTVPLPWDNRVYRAGLDLAVGLAAACAITQAARPFAPGRGGPLDWPVLRHIGRISYGLYVYHWFVPEAFARFHPAIVNPHGVVPKLASATLFTLISLAMAEVSWWFVEKPVLGLKDRLNRFDGRVRTPLSDGQLPAAAADSTPG